MTNQGHSVFSATQKDIDQQQAEIRAINQRATELEAQQQAQAKRPSPWRRLLRWLYR
ncbi:MAG: hypothetical protein IJV24_00955 [Prevotella sp.]|nr:hypothetical protein [Prevotella sp.]